MSSFLIRLNPKEKKVLKKLADQSHMNVSEYIRRKLFEDNSEIGEIEQSYFCPNSEKLNYIQTAFNLLNQELLVSIIKKQFGNEANEVINQSFDNSVRKLEEKYGYRKTRE